MFKNKALLLIITGMTITNVYSQTIQFENQEFEISNVKASVIDFEGEKVLKLERDLEKIPFDVNHLENTVDEATFLKLANTNIDNGVIEVRCTARFKILLHLSLHKVL